MEQVCTYRLLAILRKHYRKKYIHVQLVVR